MERRPRLSFLQKCSCTSKTQKNKHQFFDDMWKNIFKGLPKKVQKISLEAKKPKINVNWRKETISCLRHSRERQIDVLLSKRSSYTGLPEKTFTTLKYLKVQWSLVFTAAHSTQHEIISKDMSHFSSSLSVFWSDINLPPVGDLHSCDLIALTPLFYEYKIGDNNNKMSPTTDSVCTRSLVTTVPLKGNFYKSLVFFGKDDFVSIYLHHSGLLFGIWHDKSPKKCSIAFITFYRHSLNIIDMILGGTSNTPYDYPFHEPIIDDLDGKYGLQRYSAVIELRTSRKLLWNFQVSEFYRAHVEDNWLIMTDERPTHHGCYDIQKSIRLPWKAGSIKGVIKNVSIIDFTLIDGNKEFIWCTSAPVLASAVAENEVNFDDDGTEKRLMLLEDAEKGTMALAISVDPKSNSCAVRSIEVRLKISFINQWFCTRY